MLFLFLNEIINFFFCYEIHLLHFAFLFFCIFISFIAFIYNEIASYICFIILQNVIQILIFKII